MKSPIKPRDIPLLATIAVLLALCGFGAAAYPHFASWAVARNLLVDNAFLGVAAVGATFVILSGGIDLSVGSMMAFTGVLVASLIEHAGLHPLAAISVGLLVGAGFGTVQGWLIQHFELPPFLVTLAGMFFARGAAFAVHPQSIGVHHPFVASTLNEAMTLRLPLGPRGMAVPLVVLLFLGALLCAWFTLRQTRFGRGVYAIGDDAQAAGLMGLPVGRTRVLVYTTAGLCSALAGVVFVLYQQSGDPASCKGLELDAIAAVVIGGTLLTGGVGTVMGTAIGVMILGLIQTIITFQGDLSSWWTRIVVGALVLVFVGLQRGLDALGGGVLRARAARG